VGLGSVLERGGDGYFWRLGAGKQMKEKSASRGQHAGHCFIYAK
jgi:hypothetical protein